MSALRFFVCFFVFVFLFFINCNLTSASEVNGTIDETFKYAWGENIGWINFACDECNVYVTDDSISGNAWSSQYGWINLSPTTSGVVNDGEGTLSGFAWSSNLGWINFSGVTINSNGEFLGYATIKSDNSQISFNCINGDSCASVDFKVKTDWRPADIRSLNQSGGSRSTTYRLPTISFILPPTITPEFLQPTLPDITPSTVIAYIGSSDESNNNKDIYQNQNIKPESGKWWSNLVNFREIVPVYIVVLLLLLLTILYI